MDKYMLIAINEAKKAKKKGEVPIGAVIVKNGKIIAKNHNRKETKNIVTKHAEILVIEKANKKLKSWRLNDCILYVTMEPCMMCTGAIIQARIKKVIYGVENINFGYSNELIKNKIEVQKNCCLKECKKIIVDFFKEKRKQ